MRSISEYHEFTTLYELFVHFYDQVINRNINDLSELLEYSKNLPLNNKMIAIYKKVFNLIKEIHWGGFKDLDPQKYPKLWKELVIPNKTIEGTGDLKRNMSISNIFVGMVDIHKYTEY